MTLSSVYLLRPPPDSSGYSYLCFQQIRSFEQKEISINSTFDYVSLTLTQTQPQTHFSFFISPSLQSRKYHFQKQCADFRKKKISKTSRENSNIFLPDFHNFRLYYSFIHVYCSSFSIFRDCQRFIDGVRSQKIANSPRSFCQIEKDLLL